MENWCKLTMVMGFTPCMDIIRKTWLRLDSLLKKERILPEWEAQVTVLVPMSTMKFGLMIML